MATSQMNEVIRHLRRAVLLRDGAGLTDGRLLEDYISHRDEAALAALVSRHGPMVWGVCRRVLGNYHDAEDAFQATFLVLVRKAVSIAAKELLANWLYGVAHQTALKARATAAKRKVRESQVAEMAEPEQTRQDLWHDLQPLLDQELSRLPDKYRAPIILCDLEGKTRKEAALQLGWPEGTVAGRLARARGMLAKRLTRYVGALSGGALVTMLAQEASACVPASVVSSTTKAASLLAAGQVVAAGGISAKVITLTEGVLKAMFLNKLTGVLGVPILVAAVLLGGGGYLLTSHAQEKVTELTIPLKVVDKKKPADEDFNKTILALEAKMWEAVRNFDADALEKLYADDLICFSERGRSDKAANVEVAKRLGDTNIKFGKVEIVRLNKDGAVITYILDCDTVTRDGTVQTRWRNNRVSDTWARRDGRWVLVFSQMTQMPSADHTGKDVVPRLP
jgi:RNA polymerase sigma factor (sigma-70 family)